MNKERWKQVKTLHQHALETAPEKRLSILSENCAGDEELYHEVVSMLEFADASERAFEKPLFEFAVNVFADGDKRSENENFQRRLGEQIDNYRIVSEVGRGGMGIVYLAERVDGLFNQRVAMKIIKRGMDTDAILKRFVMERQILASLEHPFIARLLDGGTTEDGLPYFVMEYVEGSPVTEFCREKNLNLPERLKLFRKICEAVQYAHQNLLVHRDLKSSNILINRAGEPKLLDFGIAKLLNAEFVDENEATQTVHRMLTPEYASPEQIRGEKITTQSDVYSLGVLLGKMISDFGFAASGNHRRMLPMLKQNNGSAHSKAGNNGQKPKNDLQAILQTALHEDIVRRYSSVEQFSEDVRRFLEGLPIRARKDSLSYLTTRFVYRHQRAVFASVLMVLALLGATVFSFWQAQRASAEKAKAERRFKDVRKLANAVLFDYHDKIENLSGSTEVRRKMLEDSLAYLDSLARETENDGSLLQEIGAAYLKIGDVQGKPFAANAGDTNAALNSYRKAEQIFSKLLEKEPENDSFKIELSRAFDGIGKIQMRQHEADASIESHRKALAIREELALENPVDDNLRQFLASSYFNLGDALALKSGALVVNQSDEAEAYNLVVQSYDFFRRAQQIRQDLANQNPQDTDRLFALAVSLQRMGFRALSFAAWKKNRNFAPPSDDRSVNDFHLEAINNHHRAIELAGQIEAQQPENAKVRRFIADELMIVAEPQIEIGDFVTAEKNLNAARVAFEEIAASDAANVEAQRDLVNVYERLGRLFVARENATAAHKNYQKAEQILSEIVRLNPTRSDETQLAVLRYWSINTKDRISRQSR